MTDVVVGALLTKRSQIQALNRTQKVSSVPIPTPAMAPSCIC
jgi:hypothetical protein